ncbi:MAG: DsrE family protein [Chloroflexi bacterium]|nr:DsrE family protein [Chloroflexota bacterium]
MTEGNLKTLTLFLATTPYASENTHTALQLARAALDKGYAVNLFASADGVHNFTQDQSPKGLPDAGKGFAELMARGLRVELCGTCLNFRGIGANDILPGSQPSTMKRLFGLMKSSDVFITLGS